ncbi:MAG: preprotein translocase subunit SecG [Bacteroidota bacterium]
MFVVLGILSILIAAALIFAVVIQNSKGGGLSSTFGGGATQMFGARRSNEMIEKITWYLAIGLAVIAFVANIFGTTTVTTDNSLRMQEEILANPVSLPDPNAVQPIESGGDAPAATSTPTDD